MYFGNLFSTTKFVYDQTEIRPFEGYVPNGFEEPLLETRFILILIHIGNFDKFIFLRLNFLADFDLKSNTALDQ